jgi:hypothetical protein
MRLKIIATSYGAFTAHEKNCPIVERDWNLHGVTEYEMEASSVNQIAQEMQNTLEIPQSLAIVTKRIICHFCMSQQSVFPGSGFKAR